MTKHLSSKEFVLYQVNADTTSNYSFSGNKLSSVSLGGSKSTTGASILRPEIKERPEWTDSLEDIPKYYLPRYLQSLHSTVALGRHVRYIADKFDRQWIESRKEQLGQSDNNNENSVKCTHSCSDSDNGATFLDQFEDTIARLDLKAYNNPEMSRETIHLAHPHESLVPQSTLDDIRLYWLRKREALGGNIPCTTALRPCVKEDNQNLLCRSDILGDCPLPFKRRDWISTVMLRSNVSDTRKRKREKNTCVSFEFCDCALKLSTQLLWREELLIQHTCLSMYELSLLRRVGVTPDDSQSSLLSRLQDTVKEEDCDCDILHSILKHPL